jgi:hypothetical protein
MVNNKTYSNDSLYPDKWDKPTITYIPTCTIDDNNIINSIDDTESIGGDDAVITNIICNDKERFIPPLYPITQKSGYGVNSNYGYLNTSKNFLDGKDVLDDLYYPSQQYNLINNDTGDNDTGGDNDTANKRYYNVVDSIKGNGRIISSNNDISPYINNINSNDILTCNGCSCCGGVVYNDDVNNRIKGGTTNIIQSSGSCSKTQTLDPYYTQNIDINTVASMSSNDYNKRKFNSCYTNVTNPYTLNSLSMPLLSPVPTPPKASIASMSSNDSKIPQLEPRYTSVYIPTNGYTWASTPMPNTDNYYVDTIARNFSPILFSQNGRQLGGYRFDEIKTGQRNKNKESFNSQNSKYKYNSINKIIFVVVVIIIIFLIMKYNLI